MQNNKELLEKVKTLEDMTKLIQRVRDEFTIIFSLWSNEEDLLTKLLLEIQKDFLEELHHKLCLMKRVMKANEKQKIVDAINILSTELGHPYVEEENKYCWDYAKCEKSRVLTLIPDGVEFSNTLNQYGRYELQIEYKE